MTQPPCSRLSWVVALAVFFTAGLVAWAQIPQPGDKLYPKRDSMPIYANPDSTSNVVAKLQWGKAYPVGTIQGRWLTLTVGEKTGWIYVGNVSRDKPPDENKSQFLGTGAGEVSTAAAARGLEKGAVAYGKRHDLGGAIADVQWVERFNAQIDTGDVQAYMKSKGLGPYGSR
jgi:hypothetical protein